MNKLKAQTWSELEIFYDDVPLKREDVEELGWVKESVARLHWGRAALRLSIGPFVGRLVIPERCAIDVQELVPGTVATLLPLSHTGLKWMSQAAAAGPVKVEPWAALMEQFVDALVQYSRSGPVRRYVPQEWNTQHPRGRIDLRRTLVAHRARGRHDLMACSVRYLTEDNPLNRLLLAAALRAEAVLRSGGYETALRRLRESIGVLRAVSPSVVPDVAAARRDSVVHQDDKLALLADLAEMIVYGVGLLAEESDLVEQPVSVWLNVERIFEQAMLRLVAELSSVEVRSGHGDGTKLLTGGENLDANPDIVLVGPTGTAVLDAKYRRHGANVAREEVYQLIAHANAYSARAAALITPRIGAEDVFRYLGHDHYGRRFDVIVVEANSVSDVVDTLTDWLAANGFR